MADLTCCKRTKLLTSKPAPISKTKESATSQTKSAFRQKCRRQPPIAATLFSLSARCRSNLEARQAGTRPNSSVVKIVKSPVKTSTRASTLISCTRGRFTARSSLTKPTAQNANNKPDIPPNDARIKLSTSNCLTIRQRLAPKARRIANSFCRPEGRTKNKFATFAQAISNTRATAPNNTSTSRKLAPTASSRKGDNVIRQPPSSPC